MVYYTKIKINGVEGGIYDDYINGNVDNSTGENNTASNFNFQYDNTNGLFTSLLSINKEVEVWIDSAPIVSTAGKTKIFDGIIEDIDTGGGQTKNRITIKGRDYTARLQDVTIEPEVYNNQEVSVIINDFMSKYVRDVTYTPVVIGYIISRITFNHTNVFDALKRLADQTKCVFWVDVAKALHFVKKGTTSSGYTFDNTNTLIAKWIQSRKDIINEVWVYGGQVFSGWKNTFNSLGSVTTGSVFTLDYKPHSTNVTVGGTQKLGGVYNMSSIPLSGTQYLIDYNNKYLIFVSGTSTGDNIPSSGASIICTYDRALNIVKVKRDVSSINSYELRQKIIQDNNITDPNEAVARCNMELKPDPQYKGTIDIKGTMNIIAGQTCVANFPFDGVNNQVYDILNVKYNLNKSDLLSESILTIGVNLRDKDINDTIKDLFKDVKQLQSDSIGTPEVITRIETGAGSIGIRRHYNIYTQNISGNFLIWNHQQYGNWSTQKWVSGAPYTRILNTSGGDY